MGVKQPEGFTTWLSKEKNGRAGFGHGDDVRTWRTQGGENVRLRLGVVAVACGLLVVVVCSYFFIPTSVDPANNPFSLVSWSSELEDASSPTLLASYCLLNRSTHSVHIDAVAFEPEQSGRGLEVAVVQATLGASQLAVPLTRPRKDHDSWVLNQDLSPGNEMRLQVEMTRKNVGAGPGSTGPIFDRLRIRYRKVGHPTVVRLNTWSPSQSTGHRRLAGDRDFWSRFGSLY